MIIRNVLFAAALTLAPLHAQQFEVATVKPSGPPDFEHCSGDGMSPGRMTMKCNTLESLILMAYADSGNVPPPLFNRLQIAGAPAWIKSDPYDIEATMQGSSTPQQMKRMLQALLEDRFKLKLHRETRELPVYALSVTKSGLKLQPLTEPCTPRNAPPQSPGPMPPNFCDTVRRPNIKGSNMTLDLRAMSMPNFSAYLSANLDRTVIDKTGVAGIFDYHLEFALDETTPGFPGVRGAPAADPAPSIFTAIQQLGLKLEPAKGPVEFLVVDHVEKPSGN